MQKNFTKIFFAIFLFLQVLIMAGCGGGSSSNGGANSGPSNTSNVTPTVSMVSPKDNSVGVTTTPNIVLKFSEPVHNVNTSTVTLHESQPDGTQVALGTVSLAADNVTYTFTLPQNSTLNSMTKYYVVVSNAITSVSTGRAVGTTNFNFQTGDFAAPTVSISPADGTTNQSLSPTIQLSFSTAVTNVTESTVILHASSPSGEPVALNAFTKTGNVYTTSPKVNLDSSTTYYIELTSGINAVSNNVPLVPVSSSFTTGNYAAPTAVMLNPANGSTNVSSSTNIQLQFSTAVNNVTESTVTLHEDSPTGTSIPVDSVAPGGDNSYTLILSHNLPPSKVIYVVLSSGITSVENNVPLVATNFSFTTSSVAVPTPTMVNPINGATNVSTSTTIQLQFSEPVNGVSTSTVTLHESSPTGTAIATTAIVAGANNGYSFSATSALKPFTQYYVVISAGITAKADGEQVSPTNFNFTTGKNTSAPTVIMTSPDNNSTISTLSPTIQLQFSEAVDGVSTSTVTLHESSPNGAVIATSNPTVGTNHVYSFSPTESLNPATSYYVVIESGITSSSTGLPLTITNFTFTTDITAVVAMINPANGSTGVSTLPIITLQFSKAVNGVNTSTVTLHESSPTGAVVSTSTIKAESNNMFAFSPTSQLHIGSTYYVVIGSGITSADNDFPVAPTSFNFTVETSTSSAFAYISYNSGIAICPVMDATGELGTCNPVESSVGAYSVTINPTNDFAYIVDKSKNTITECTINKKTGSLSFCQASADSKFNAPTSISFSPDGLTAYVANHGKDQVLTCMIDTVGALPSNCTSTGSGFDHPQQVLVNSTNTFAYVSNSSGGGNNVKLCNVESTGLNNCVTTGSGFTDPLGMVFSNDNKYLFTTTDTAIYACSIDQESGALSSCQDAAVGFTALSGIATYKNNVYVTDSGNGAITVCKEDLNDQLKPCTYAKLNMFGATGIAIAKTN